MTFSVVGARRLIMGAFFCLTSGACGDSATSAASDDGSSVFFDVPAPPGFGTPVVPTPVPPVPPPVATPTPVDTVVPPASTPVPPADGTAGTAGEGSGGTGGDGAAGMDAASDLEPFSFFVTSLEVMRELSGSQDGFGGNLGGLSGADNICQQAADKVGFGAKTWKAFLSAADGGNGQPVHAIDRIGEGPWYDRNGRLIADNRAGLIAGNRPAGDAATINDLPNEYGEGLMAMGDTHDIMTGSNVMGQLDSTDPANTCNNWTSTTAQPTGGGFGFPGSPAPAGGLKVGHAWPAMSGQHWITSHTESSCAAGVNLVQNGPGDGSSVGAGGGWGGFYCFALTP